MSELVKGISLLIMALTVTGCGTVGSEWVMTCGTIFQAPAHPEASSMIFSLFGHENTIDIRAYVYYNHIQTSH